MTIRQEVLELIERLSDEQLNQLLPLLISTRDSVAEAVSSESSQAYQQWLSSENNVYDELFADELAAR
jgi:hypothetical protein